MQESRRSHRPPHRFDENDIYFLTVSTYHKQPLFNNDAKKTILKNVLAEKARPKGVRIIAYAVMDNHYHLLIRTAPEAGAADFIESVNGKSSFLLNREEWKMGRKVWQNYWDRIVRDERDFWVRFNYIHHNPVKHGYAQKAEDYAHSSFRKWVERMGEGWMAGVVEEYPIRDFMDESELAE